MVPRLGSSNLFSFLYKSFLCDKFGEVSWNRHLSIVFSSDREEFRVGFCGRLCNGPATLFDLGRDPWSRRVRYGRRVAVVLSPPLVLRRKLIMLQRLLLLRLLPRLFLCLLLFLSLLHPWYVTEELALFLSLNVSFKLFLEWEERGFLWLSSSLVSRWVSRAELSYLSSS